MSNQFLELFKKAQVISLNGHLSTEISVTKSSESFLTDYLQMSDEERKLNSVENNEYFPEDLVHLDYLLALSVQDVLNIKLNDNGKWCIQSERSEKYFEIKLYSLVELV